MTASHNPAPALALFALPDEYSAYLCIFDAPMARALGELYV